jgi:4a-hydroxytetrahydrobiopterin dehydratase
MERRLLTHDEITDGLKELEGWEFDNDGITKRFKFSNFAEALAFVNRVGEIAEAADHHPDITFGWGYAEISTTTHDRGGVTDVDFSLVREINKL